MDTTRLRKRKTPARHRGRAAGKALPHVQQAAREDRRHGRLARVKRHELQRSRSGRGLLGRLIRLLLLARLSRRRGQLRPDALPVVGA